jgi:hypothetical protein
MKGKAPGSRKPFWEGKRSWFLLFILILSLLLLVNGLSLVKPDLFKQIQTEIGGWWK